MNLNEVSSRPKNSVNMFSLLVKLDRLAAWILFFAIITYAITGYGMTRGFIDDEISRSWHLAWLGVIGLISFVIHTSWAIHLFFCRKNIWNRTTKFCLAFFYILMIAFFLYLHFFYTKPVFENQVTQNFSYLNVSASSSVGINNDAASSKASTTASVIFSKSSLAKYNGLNGQPAYVAVDGLVYDMTNVFRNGKHHGYMAGQDLSQAFYSEHPASYLNSYPIVGSYSR